MTDFQLKCMKIAKASAKKKQDKLKAKEEAEAKWRATNLCLTCKEKDDCQHGKRIGYGYIIVGCTTSI